MEISTTYEVKCCEESFSFSPSNIVSSEIASGFDSIYYRSCPSCGNPCPFLRTQIRFIVRDFLSQ